MLRFLIGVLLLFAIVAIGVVMMIYSSEFGANLSSSHREWSEFGDFFGGTVGTVLAFVSLVALLITIYIQSLELRATREELCASRKAHEKQAQSMSEQVEIAKSEAKASLTFSMLERWASKKMRKKRMIAWDHLAAKYGFSKSPINLGEIGEHNPDALEGFTEVCQFVSDLNKTIHLNKVDPDLAHMMFFNSLYPWFEFIPRIELGASRDAGSPMTYGTRVDQWYRDWVFTLQDWFEERIDIKKYPKAGAPRTSDNPMA